ncbi:MAG: NIPSNAP family protein [bacterium]
MTINKHYLVTIGLTLVALGFTASTILPATLQAQSSGKVFELRTYTTAEGKLPNLLARFRDHTMQIFERHGIENVAYWVPKDTPNTLIYIISHDSSEAATENWQGFRSDPEWPGVAEASGVGRVQVVSVFMDATDFSPMK